MKKLFFVVLAATAVLTLSAQKKKDWSNVINRAGDHLVLQLSSDHWIGTPDSIKSHIKGLSRGLNMYVMLDKPFRANPRFSVAFGLGIGSSNIYFRKMSIDIKSKNTVLPFNNLDTLQRFKKYKLSTTFLEIPLELRFSADPENPNKSIKGAIGFKLGTLLNAHTKGKILQDKEGRNINSYTAKENNKSFFNSTRLAITARAGYGNFSLFGSYQLNNIFKDGVAADVKLFQIGLSLAGL